MQIGDKVSWTETHNTRHGFSMKRRDGVIHSLKDGIATVKTSRAGFTHVSVSVLRSPEAKSAITEIVEALRVQSAG